MNALAGYYAKRAPEYDRIYEKPERQSDLRELRQYVKESFSGRRLLEIACGTGWWTEVVSSTARSVTATDINEEVLAMARARNSANGTVSFQRCDAFRLEEVTGAFDAALAAFWWSHLTRADLDRFLDGLHARLESGSRIVFLDNRFVAGSSTAISRRDEDGNTYQQRTLDDGSMNEVLKNFPSVEEITDVLQKRGTGLSIQRLKYYWTASYTLPS
jgi:SAM-dependent methyltransferase